MIKVIPHRMVGECGATTGAQVAGEADLDGNLSLRQFFDQFGILPGMQTVANTFGSQIQCAPNGIRAGGFAGVGSEVQAVLSAIGINVAKKLGRGPPLVASNAEADNVTLFVAYCEFRDRLSRLGAEVAHSVKNP